MGYFAERYLGTCGDEGYDPLGGPPPQPAYLRQQATEPSRCYALYCRVCQLSRQLNPVDPAAVSANRAAADALLRLVDRCPRCGAPLVAVEWTPDGITWEGGRAKRIAVIS